MEVTARPDAPDIWQRLPLFRDHPPGLAVCFLTEMWERFSYYGMRALLIFYLTRQLLYEDDEAFLIYAAYGSMVYLLTVLGGAVADRWLGPRKAVTLGALLLVAGHLSLAFEGSLTLFYFSLALIVTGVGFLKSNISTVVGALYEAGDIRRDAGFTVFYMGINLGAAIAPLLCGWLGETYGWGYGFGLAGVGMLAGLVLFLRGQHWLEGHADPPDSARLQQRIAPGLSLEWALYLGALAVVVVVWWILQRPFLVGSLLSVTMAGLGLFILWYAVARCERVERDRLLVCSTLIVFSIGFWAFYEQMGSSLALFADRLVDREVLGAEIPASTLQSLPAVFVIALAPLFSMMWLGLAKRGSEPSTPLKFALAIGQMSLAFLILAFGAGSTASGTKVAMVWYVLNFFFMVTGELCLSPVGLSMVTKLSPKNIVATMMGAFLLAYGASNYLSGLIARWTSAETIGGEIVDFEAALANYTNVYARLGLMALGVAVILYLLTPILESRMHGAERMREGVLARAYRSLRLLPPKPETEL